MIASPQSFRMRKGNITRGHIPTLVSNLASLRYPMIFLMDSTEPFLQSKRISRYPKEFLIPSFWMGDAHLEVTTNKELTRHDCSRSCLIRW